MKIIGIDPGATGAMAVLHKTRAVVYPFKNLTPMDIYQLFIRESLEPFIGFIEDVHAMPGQGVTSMFTFGKNVGFLHGMLTASGCPFETVAPMRWQKELGLGRRYPDKASRKKAHKQWCEQQYPRTSVNIETADALCIAEYGRRIVNQRGK